MSTSTTTQATKQKQKQQQNSNSITFPSAPSFTSTSTTSTNSTNSTYSNSPTTPSLLLNHHHHQQSHTAPLPLPLPTLNTQKIPNLRHTSASLFELLRDNHDEEKNQKHSKHLHLHDKSLNSSPSLLLLSPKSPNSIQFPSTSPTTSTFKFTSTRHDDESESESESELELELELELSEGSKNVKKDELIERWLTSTFIADPNYTEANKSPILELDLLVGFKSITDHLNLPPLDRHQAWIELRNVFPTAKPWVKPTPAGLRSNKEFLVIGIKLKQHSNTIPFRQLDFSKPLPEEILSKDLVEFMRKKICTLQVQSQLLQSQIQNNSNPNQNKRRKLIKYNNHLGHRHHQIKKQYFINQDQKKFRFEKNINLQNSSTLVVEKNHVALLGHKIWSSLIKVCKLTKDNFLSGEILTASWIEHMNKYEFDLIVKNSKSNQNKTMETSTQKFIKIIHPFNEKNIKSIKLFKFQPISQFNSLVFNHNNHTDQKGLSSSLFPTTITTTTTTTTSTSLEEDSILIKDLCIIQITSVKQEDNNNKVAVTLMGGGRGGQEEEKENLCPTTTTRSKRNLLMMNQTNNKSRIGKSLDKLSNPINKNETILDGNGTTTNQITGLFNSLNLNLRTQRKSLNLDKFFHSNNNNNNIDNNDTALLVEKNNGLAQLLVQEILVEFNLAFLNQLTFQVKLFKFDG